MKRTGLVMLLLVCFLISMPVVAADLALAKGEQVETLLLDHQVMVGQQITINNKGEVVLTEAISVSEYENYVTEYTSIAETRLQDLEELIVVQNNELTKQLHMLNESVAYYESRKEREVLLKFIFGTILLF